jgi:hypothetical protein
MGAVYLKLNKFPMFGKKEKRPGEPERFGRKFAADYFP